MIQAGIATINSDRKPNHSFLTFVLAIFSQSIRMILRKMFVKRHRNGEIN